MLAVDTNVVVRFLTRDEPTQSMRARAIFERETVFLPKTVMLEAEWVLRDAYRFAPPQIATAFASLVALPKVQCEDATAVEDAILWMARGMDFADALHLASARQVGRLATFDRRLIKQAGRIANVVAVSA
jgi:predicted nucleic-acid-binding protein